MKNGSPISFLLQFLSPNYDIYSPQLQRTASSYSLPTIITKNKWSRLDHKAKSACALKNRLQNSPFHGSSDWLFDWLAVPILEDILALFQRAQRSCRGNPIPKPEQNLPSHEHRNGWEQNWTNSGRCAACAWYHGVTRELVEVRRDSDQRVWHDCQPQGCCRHRQNEWFLFFFILYSSNEGKSLTQTEGHHRRRRSYHQSLRD